jgi:hypothetical protein
MAAGIAHLFLCTDLILSAVGCLSSLSINQKIGNKSRSHFLLLSSIFALSMMKLPRRRSLQVSEYTCELKALEAFYLQWCFPGSYVGGLKIYVVSLDY